MISHQSKMALGRDWTDLLHGTIERILEGTKNDCLPSPQSMIQTLQRAAKKYMKMVGEPTYTRKIPMNCNMICYPLDCVGKLSGVKRIRYYDHEEGCQFQKSWQELDPCEYYADIECGLLNLYFRPHKDYCPNGLEITMSYYPEFDDCKMPNILSCDPHFDNLLEQARAEFFLMSGAPWHDKTEAERHLRMIKSLAAKNVIRNHKTPKQTKTQSTSFWRI